MREAMLLFCLCGRKHCFSKLFIILGRAVLKSGALEALLLQSVESSGEAML